MLDAYTTGPLKKILFRKKTCQLFAKAKINARLLFTLSISVLLLGFFDVHKQNHKFAYHMYEKDFPENFGKRAITHVSSYM